MQHFPIFLNLREQFVVIVGWSPAAEAKLKLIEKTEAKIRIFADPALISGVCKTSVFWLYYVGRNFQPGDGTGAALVYAATEDARQDARIKQVAQADGALVNIVDNLDDSAFITPAIVDRDPVTVAIGTEGAAPVLARAIKRDLEDRLSPRLGMLARIGKAFRPMAENLPHGRARRKFWSDYYFDAGPRAEDPSQALDELLAPHLGAERLQGHVEFVGAGPGDPELLTLKARKAL